MDTDFSEGPSFEEQDRESRSRFQVSVLWTLLLLVVPWTVNFLESQFQLSFREYGLFPRTLSGLWGILTMPFLHSGFDHLYHNSFGLIVLGLCIFFFYPKVAWRVIGYSALLTGALVWLFARPAYHIGASGVVYTLSAFLFLSGCIRRDRASRGSALIVALLYGGSVWGVFPLQEGISWEGHLFGSLCGCWFAIWYRKIDLPTDLSGNHESEEEDEDEDSHPAFHHYPHQHYFSDQNHPHHARHHDDSDQNHPHHNRHHDDSDQNHPHHNRHHHGHVDHNQEAKDQEKEHPGIHDPYPRGGHSA